VSFRSTERQPPYTWKSAVSIALTIFFCVSCLCCFNHLLYW